MMWPIQSKKDWGVCLLRSMVYEPNRGRLDFIYAPVLCPHINHLYPELHSTIKDFESYRSAVSRTKTHNRRQTKTGSRVKLGPVPAQAKVLQMQRRPESEQEATHPHLYFALGVPSHLHSYFTSQCSAYPISSGF